LYDGAANVRRELQRSFVVPKSGTPQDDKLEASLLNLRSSGEKSLKSDIILKLRAEKA
jgi:hypothetical protein